MRRDATRRHALWSWYAFGFHISTLSAGDGELLCATSGDITLGDIMEILPFDDSVVVLELDGKTIWETLEAGFSLWPATEGYAAQEIEYLMHS
jgi:hypothetical protein